MIDTKKPTLYIDWDGDQPLAFQAGGLEYCCLRTILCTKFASTEGSTVSCKECGNTMVFTEKAWRKQQ